MRESRFLAESVGFDLRCGAGHLGLKRAAGTFLSSLGFESLMQKRGSRMGASFLAESVGFEPTWA